MSKQSNWYTNNFFPIPVDEVYPWCQNQDAVPVFYCVDENRWKFAGQFTKESVPVVRWKFLEKYEENSLQPL